jgi:hypothetical protein
MATMISLVSDSTIAYARLLICLQHISGEVECSLDMLEDCTHRGVCPLMIRNTKDGKTAGSIFVRSFKIIKNPSFLDYIRSGTQVRYMDTCIDSFYL